MNEQKDPDLYYPQFSKDVNPAVAESIRTLFDHVYLVVGKKGKGVVHDQLKVKQNLDLTARGAQIKIKECDGCAAGQTSDASMGTATLIAGTIEVRNSLIKNKTRIVLTPQNAGTAQGNLWVSARKPGESFTITSSNAGDDREVMWLLIQPSGLNES